MRTESFVVTALFPVDAATLYNAWLSSKEHAAFTGGAANVKPIEGSNYSAWDGYISGEVLGLEPHSRILQSWRTDEFPDDADDSTIEILLRDSTQGCQFTLRHTGVPAGDGEKYFKGWQDHYVAPMQAYFAGKK